MAARICIAVVGGASCDSRTARLAYEVGRELARHGALLLCGGRGGVMERSAAGCREGGGQTVAVLPGRSAAETPPNESIDLAIFTGLGQARNQVLVLSAAAVIAVGGGWGTLSEIALAIKHRIPVVVLESWGLEHPSGQPEPLLEAAASPAEAVAKALAAGRSAGRIAETPAARADDGGRHVD